MAASIVGNLFHMRNDRIRESFQNFENSEHRIERFAEFDDVQFINDSKATNAAAAWHALNTMTRPIVWIAGGIDKGNDYGTLLPVVKENVVVLIAMGKLNDKLIAAFEKHVPKLIQVTNMEEAVAAAIEVAEKGQAVLLAPACASFDLFDSYEERGEKFKEIVENHYMTPAEREAKVLAQAESNTES